MNNLVERVLEYQNKRKLTDQSLCDFLGLHRSTWVKIKGGQRKPGMKFLRAVNHKLFHVEISDKLITNSYHGQPGKKLGMFRRTLKFYYLRFKRFIRGKPLKIKSAR